MVKPTIHISGPSEIENLKLAAHIIRLFSTEGGQPYVDADNTVIGLIHSDKIEYSGVFSKDFAITYEKRKP